MKTFRGILWSGLVLLLGACTTTPGLYTIAPQHLGATAEMRRPGFWISQMADPDQVVLDAAGIAELNRLIVEEKKLRQDLFQSTVVPSLESLAKRFASTINGMEKRALFDANLKPVPAQFWKDLRTLVLPPADAAAAVRWAVTTRFTHQRILPSEANLNAERGDVEFDELQNTGIDLGTVIKVYQDSADGQWVFGATDLSEGWVRVNDVGFATAEEIQSALTQPFGVIIAARSDVYADSDRRAFRTLLRMGTRLPLAQRGPGVTEVRLPDRDAAGRLVWAPAWIANDEVSPQYLPYTRRTILEQAFKFLHAPYDWGDERQEQDCSSFLRMVFGSVGIHLPRNSAAQGRSGVSVAAFTKATPVEERLARIAEAPAGNTLLQMPGHIMLYLGQAQGRPWVISEIWAYRDDVSTGSRIRVINRTSVTDLDLGTGSKTGSLLLRLVNVTEVVDAP